MSKIRMKPEGEKAVIDTIFMDDDYHHNLKVQIAKYPSMTPAVNIFQYLTKEQIKKGYIIIPPTYEMIKAIIDGLVTVNGYDEVEKQLNIVIGGIRE